MLKLVTRQGRCAVCAFCDQCRKEITDAERAMYTWKKDAQRQPITGDIIFLHKGACDRAFSVGNVKSEWSWGELSWLPIYLGNNIGLDWDKTTASMVRFAEATW